MLVYAKGSIRHLFIVAYRPLSFPVKICLLEKLMTFLAGTDDASRSRKAGRRAAA